MYDYRAYILCHITNLMYPMRVSAKSEILGLDRTQHNESIMLPEDESFHGSAKGFDESTKSFQDDEIKVNA